MLRQHRGQKERSDTPYHPRHPPTRLPRSSRLLSAAQMIEYLNNNIIIEYELIIIQAETSTIPPIKRKIVAMSNFEQEWIRIESLWELIDIGDK